MTSTLPTFFAGRAPLDRNLALEVVRVTEAAALSSARMMGRGAKNEADEAAVLAMRRAFDGLQIRGTVVICEGERDEAPMLFIGETMRCCAAVRGLDVARVSLASRPAGALACLDSRLVPSGVAFNCGARPEWGRRIFQ